MRLTPYILAVFFMCWAMRGATTSDVCLNDATRHAMNGAYVYDLVRSAEFAAPIEYGKRYYSYLPALSLPYHPPLFPILEAVFFLFFGVNPFAARLAVAVCVGISALLLYRLILATHDSHILAASTVATFFALGMSQTLATDVMLEFPAMAFVLAALNFAPRGEENYPLRRGVAFALLAGAAVWTKQQSVFLGLMPFLYAAIAPQRWKLLLTPTIWLSAALFGVFVLALMLLPAQVNWTGLDQVTRGEPVSYIFARNLFVYWKDLCEWFGSIPGVLLFLAFTFFLAKSLPNLLKHKSYAPNADSETGAPATDIDFYLAWVIASLLPLLLMHSFDKRYLVFTCPPLLVIGYTAIRDVCRRFLPTMRYQYAVAAVALIACAINLYARPMTYLRGASEAAQVVHAAGSSRTLYLGHTNGSFIFAMRSLNADNTSVVLRGDKLPAEVFQPERFAEFAHRYGINHIVVERPRAPDDSFARPWREIDFSQLPTLVRVAEVPLVSSLPDFNGTLEIFRHTAPSPTPETHLSVPLSKTRSMLDLKLDSGAGR